MADSVSAWLSTGGYPPGSRVAGYRLEQRVGRGAMAVVFRARDERHGRQVALKILAPDLTGDPVFRERFIREARLAVQLDDPHIIPVFEAGEADGVLFIAMRLVEGGDVGSLVRSGGALAPGRVAEIVSQVASALDVAHARGLVHRDVKSGNLLLDVRPRRRDHVYLSDFGLTKAMLGPSDLTRAGQFLGTLGYAAPEQLQGEAIDGRTDQYALACSAFEMLCGEPPFWRDHELAMMNAQLNEPPPSPSARRAGLPAELDGVFARALATSPQIRYRSCQDFADTLRSVFGLLAHPDGAGASPGKPQAPGGAPPGPAAPGALAGSQAGPPAAHSAGASASRLVSYNSAPAGSARHRATARSPGTSRPGEARRPAPAGTSAAKPGRWRAIVAATGAIVAAVASAGLTNGFGLLNQTSTPPRRSPAASPTPSASSTPSASRRA